MSYAAGLALLISAIAVILISWGAGSDQIGGMDMGAFAGVVSAAACLLLLGGWAFRHFRHRLTESLLMLLAWVGIFIVIIGGYSFRHEFQDFGNRVLGTIAPGIAVSGRNGEVTVTRDSDGHFELRGMANDIDTRFLFDTGASQVVLRYEDARRIGINVGGLEFDRVVGTANGRTTVASILLDSVSIGTIRLNRVQASVAREGTLGENLLGMTFLSRLTSYEVRGDRLILRGRGE